MQYGLIQGYAYYLVYGISMVAAGFITDKYKLNRVYVVATGSGLTGAALVIEVSQLIRLSCLLSGRPCMEAGTQMHGCEPFTMGSACLARGTSIGQRTTCSERCRLAQTVFQCSSLALC